MQNVLWPSSKSSAPLIHSPGWVRFTLGVGNAIRALRCKQSLDSLIIAKSQKRLAKSAMKPPADMTCCASTQRENTNKHTAQLLNIKDIDIHWDSMRLNDIEVRLGVTMTGFLVFSDNDSELVSSCRSNAAARPNSQEPKLGLSFALMVSLLACTKATLFLVYQFANNTRIHQFNFRFNIQVIYSSDITWSMHFVVHQYISGIQVRCYMWHAIACNIMWSRNIMKYHVTSCGARWYLWKLLTFDPSSVQRFPPSSWQTLTLDSWQRPSKPIDIALVSAPAPRGWRILPQGAVNLAIGCIWHMRCTDAQKQQCNKIVPEPNDNTTHIPRGELGQWQRHRLRQLWQKPGHLATEHS